MGRTRKGAKRPSRAPIKKKKYATKRKVKSSQPKVAKQTLAKFVQAMNELNQQTDSKDSRHR